MLFIRPRRSATIRTRLDLDEIRERVGVIAADSGRDGTRGLLAHGYFEGGTVGARDFCLDYHFNSHKNPQTYDVHGTISETPDWRLVRLRLRAHDPWMSPWVLAFGAVLVAIPVVIEGRPLGPAVVTLAFVAAVYAFANLLYVPNVVTSRVSALLASTLSGSVLMGRQWVVPKD